MKQHITKEQKEWGFWKFWRESLKFMNVDFLNFDVSNPFKVIPAYLRYRKIVVEDDIKEKLKE